MMAVAGLAAWHGGLPFRIFVTVIFFCLIYEWCRLVGAFARSNSSRVLWIAFGLLYLGISTWTVIWTSDLRIITTASGESGVEAPYRLLSLIAVVVATDIGAYFTGRAIGGLKIAPKISPSKTWSGLIGGMTFAGLVWAVFEHYTGPGGTTHGVGDFFFGPLNFLVGAFLAVIAQIGDFFESSMKRKAGVKDSGNLIPGHGGLFDRLDGILAVFLIYGIISLINGRMVFYNPL